MMPNEYIIVVCVSVNKLEILKYLNANGVCIQCYLDFILNSNNSTLCGIITYIVQ